MSWFNVCDKEDILPNGGRCALINGEQVAIFRVLRDDKEEFFGISNFDPFSKANVLSRGLLGSLQDKLVVASPIYKQHFYLDSGICAEDPDVKLKVWQIRLDDSRIYINSDSSVAA